MYHFILKFHTASFFLFFEMDDEENNKADSWPKKRAGTVECDKSKTFYHINTSDIFLYCIDCVYRYLYQVIWN